jgi:lipopolysaccharide/colanic/teichoic acid biosynthesis glycosyltransferase
MKRLMDIVAATIALILLSPIIVVVAIKIQKNLGKPVLFRQKRPGINAEIFEMMKFRSMRDALDEEGNELPDTERLTPFGQKLRSSSLDELVEYLPLYSAEQAKRHNVRPGITGWAQINGRNAIDWDDKFKLDLWYIENQSLWLDIKILFLTVKKVLVKDGISAEGEVTMSKFTGNK